MQYVAEGNEIPMLSRDTPVVVPNYRLKMWGSKMHIYNTVVNTALLAMLTCMAIVMTVVLSDAGETLRDMRQLIPEVRETLRMVQRICQAPEYAPYCGGGV
jgi:hypothetical protein